MQALEEEGNAEKHQMAAMHQQRVLAHINQRKREAMNCYTQSLIEQPPSVSVFCMLRNGGQIIFKKNHNKDFIRTKL